MGHSSYKTSVWSPCVHTSVTEKANTLLGTEVPEQTIAGENLVVYVKGKPTKLIRANTRVSHDASYYQNVHKLWDSMGWNTSKSLPTRISEGTRSKEPKTPNSHGPERLTIEL